MLDNKSKIALVILSWNDPNNTLELIKSIYNSSYDNFDVIVVDNNSSIENFDKLKINLNQSQFKFQIIKENKLIEHDLCKKNIFIIRSTEVAEVKHARNLGVSRGYNKGVKTALINNYDFFVKLDCDFLISENFLSGMLETFEIYPNAVAVSPKVFYYINKKTNIIWWSGVKFDKNYIIFQRTGRGHRRNLDDGSYKGVHNSDGICGCCVMLKSEIVKKTGVLDEDFFFGPEDIEHAFRLKKYGDMLVNLNYHVYHKVSQSIYISGVESRIYFETLGWLTLIKKVCSFQNRVIGYSFFIIRGFYHLIRLIYKKDKRAHKGFVTGIKDFFFKNN